MKLPGRLLASSLAAALLVLQPGCGGSDASKGPLTITSLGWIEENIDPDFWTSPPPGGQTAFYDFWIHYAGDIDYGDIQYARVYLPSGSYWTLNRGATYFSAADKTIGGYGHWFASSTPNLLPIGPLRVEVKLNDGRVATSTATIPAPASLVAGSYTSMHPEDLLSPPLDSAAMIPRVPAGASGTLTAATQTIRITFSVTDSRVFSGFLWLFDAAGSYLGGFFYFRDVSTGSIGPQLGGTFHTDGTANTLTLTPLDLQLNAGATFGQVARFRIGLTDGGQYAPQTSGSLRRDCRSIGPLTSLTFL